MPCPFQLLEAAHVPPCLFKASSQITLSSASTITYASSLTLKFLPLFNEVSCDYSGLPGLSQDDFPSQDPESHQQSLVCCGSNIFIGSDGWDKTSLRGHYSGPYIFLLFTLACVPRSLYSPVDGRLWGKWKFLWPRSSPDLILFDDVIGLPLGYCFHTCRQ